jgi:hypothetical protein
MTLRRIVNSYRRFGKSFVTPSPGYNQSNTSRSMHLPTDIASNVMRIRSSSNTLFARAGIAQSV